MGNHPAQNGKSFCQKWENPAAFESSPLEWRAVRGGRKTRPQSLPPPVTSEERTIFFNAAMIHPWGLSFEQAFPWSSVTFSAKAVPCRPRLFNTRCAPLNSTMFLHMSSRENPASLRASLSTGVSSHVSPWEWSVPWMASSRALPPEISRGVILNPVILLYDGFSFSFSSTNPTSDFSSS